MAYNTKAIVTDVEENPISQYYNPSTDSYEPVEGVAGANKVILYNSDGTENNSLSLMPILNLLSQLTGTVIDENTRKANELLREDNEADRLILYNQLLIQLDRITQITEQVPQSVLDAVATLTNELEALAGEGRTTETVKGNADDLATHKADNAIHGEKIPMLKGVPSIFPYVMPGWYFAVKRSSPVVISNNTIQYIPIYINKLTEFSSLGILVGTAVASTTIEMRIYNANELFLPSTQIYDLGIVSTSTTGLKEIALEFTLDAGFYFVGLRATGEPSISNIDSTSAVQSPISGRINSSGTTSLLYTATGTMNNPATVPSDIKLTNLGLPIVLFKLKN